MACNISHSLYRTPSLLSDRPACHEAMHQGFALMPCHVPSLTQEDFSRTREFLDPKSRCLLPWNGTLSGYKSQFSYHISRFILSSSAALLLLLLLLFYSYSNHILNVIILMIIITSSKEVMFLVALVSKFVCPYVRWLAG